MSNNNNKGGIFGQGYYIALILCAAAIGISGYVYYRNTNETESQLQAAVSQQVDAVPQEEDVAVVVIQPQPTQGETEKSDVTKPTLPAQPKTALKTGAPVAGQTVSDYAMDCLSYNETPVTGVCTMAWTSPQKRAQKSLLLRTARSTPPSTMMPWA